MSARSYFTTIAVTTLAFCLVSVPAENVRAQPYPERPVKIIAPSAPGGGFDFVGRVLARHMSERLGQNFIIENRTGAGTLIGTQAVANAEPDGYTLLVGGLSNIVWNMALYEKPGYNAETDFVPIGLAYMLPYIAVVRKDLPASTLREFIDYARANPGKLNMAHAGVGAGQHLMGVALMRQTGITMAEVPYRGAQFVYPDLISGRADVFFDSSPSARPHILSGAVKALAIVSPRRSAIFPDLPTSAEASVPGWEIESWLGLFAPAKTPALIVQKLRETLAEVVKHPDVKTRFEGSAGEVFHYDIPKTEAFIKAERAKWTKLIRDASIKAQ